MGGKSLLSNYLSIYLVIILAAMAGVGWYASHTIKGFYRDQTAQDLERQAYLLAEHVQPLPSYESSGDLNLKLRAIKDRIDTRITIILPDGTVLCDSDEDPKRMENHAQRPEIAAVIAGDATGVSVRHSYTLNQDMMYVAIALRSNDVIEGVVRTSLPLDAVNNALSTIYIDIVAGGAIIALLAVLISAALSRRISRPLQALKEGARRFAKGELEHRLDLSEPSEFSELGDVMNRMAIRLDERIRTVIHQRNEQEAVLSSMVEGVLAVDLEERLLNLNQAACQMLGLDRGDKVGMTLQETIRNTALQQFVTSIFRSDRPLEADLLLGDERNCHVQAHGTVLRGADGTAIGALVVLNDVTHLRRLENIRRDFVANVSHELKTPITSIKGFVETLLTGTLDDRQETERFLKIVARHADRLNAIINDLLSLSKVEQGTERKSIELESGCLLDVLQAAVLLCDSRGKDKGVTVEMDCSENLTARINARLLEQAMVNLLDNAIKYTETGGTVTAGCKRVDGEICLLVRDQGCGISEEHLPRLFERFYRVDKARSRDLGGTGLGLAIVKHIAQSHDGRIEVESKVGEGSVFMLFLPDEGASI